MLPPSPSGDDNSRVYSTPSRGNAFLFDFGKAGKPPVALRALTSSCEPGTKVPLPAPQLTDRTGHFLSESSVYRILKAPDLITSPAFVMMMITAAERFAHPTTRARHTPEELTK